MITETAIRIIIKKRKRIKMKYFKVERSKRANRYIVSYNNFEEKTKNRYPYSQKRNDRINYYALCPSCLNTIQLIGLSHTTKVSPHGKHTGEDIRGFDTYNYQNYKYCPYAKHSEYVPPNDNDLLNEITETVQELYTLTKEHFDRIIYILQRELQIKFTANFLKNAINQYIANQGYLYPWLSEANLPYIFAYKSMQQMSCFKQSFKVGSKIYEALNNYYGLKFVQFDSEKTNEYQKLEWIEGTWTKPVFRFYKHKQRAIDGKKLQESILFCIDDNNKGETIFQKEIVFDETYFMNLVNSERNQRIRNQFHLNIANEHFIDI